MFRRKHPWMRELEGDRSVETFDLGQHRRRRWRGLRRVVVILIAVAAFIEFAGIPHLRIVHFSSPGEAFIYARYIGPMGTREVSAGEHGDGCPLIVLIPLEQSLVSHASAAWRRFVSPNFTQEEDQWQPIIIPRTRG